MAERALTEELTCPVCLATYQDPVNLGCGHCFCRHCITKALVFQKEQGRAYSCPMCQAVYEDYPSLQRNLQLCSIVENYNALQESREPSEVPCSYCLGVPNRAAKTCLTCEVSLCQQHLERHSSKKGHILLEPGQSLQERKCSEHNKLLEYYCQGDESCICVTCYIAGAHSGHTIVTLKQAQEQKRATMSQTAASLTDRVDSLAKDIGALHEGLAKVKENTVQLSKALKDQADKIIAKVWSLFDEIIDTVIEKGEQSVSQVTALAKQMEDTKGNLIQILEELNTLREQADALIFLKDYSRVQERIEQQNVQINTLHVLDLKVDPQMIQMIENNTSDNISHLRCVLNHVETILSTQIQQLVRVGGHQAVPNTPNQTEDSEGSKFWSSRNQTVYSGGFGFGTKAPHQTLGFGGHRPHAFQPVTTASLVEPKKMILTFNQNLYKHCNFNMVVSNGNKTVTASHMNMMYKKAICKCKLSIILNCPITKNMDPSPVYSLFDVTKSTNWSVGVQNGFSQWYLKSDGGNLSYESKTTLLLGKHVVNILKMQLDFQDNILGFYDASALKDIPLLVCKCDSVFTDTMVYGFGDQRSLFNHNFQKSVNIGVGLLNGSLTLL
ncbi:E3 ubiquitin/ISG15 ligase TRIM25-like [Pseudophryne corroboree]|uniref:E3 ubiquitin/ISG15 ligase TRIM25-like n=1 Tax=Pseudophryne corroboree TaxID=495146 RepID=UPI003081B901